MTLALMYVHSDGRVVVTERPQKVGQLVAEGDADELRRLRAEHVGLGGTLRDWASRPTLGQWALREEFKAAVRRDLRR